MIVEFQTEPDPDMFGWLLEYLGATFRQFRPSKERGDRFEVGAVVVNLTGKGRSFRKVAWRGAGLEVTMRSREWNFASLDARTVLRGVGKGEIPRLALAWAPLMKRGGEPGIIRRWLALADQDKDPKVRADLALAAVFAP